MAILRALGAKYGYYTPTDAIKAYYCDVALDCFVDIHDQTNGLTMSDPMGSSEGKEDKIQALIEKVHRPALALLSKNLEQHGGKFAAGNQLTVADCALVSVLVNIWENPVGPWTEAFKPVLADYPNVQQYNNNLREAFKARITDPSRPAMPM